MVRAAVGRMKRVISRAAIVSLFIAAALLSLSCGEAPAEQPTATGSTVGDRAREPTTVDENDPVATPDEQLNAPVEGQLNDQMEAVNTPGDLPPDGGNVVTQDAERPQ